MEVESNNFDWAHDTFLALNDMDLSPPGEKWPPLHSSSQAGAFSIPPTLLTHASIERFGQITPPEELSPAGPRRDSGYREGSIPVEQLHNESSWPTPNPLQSIEEFNQATEERQQAPSKRRRVSKEQASANGKSAAPHSSQQASTVSTPPKRKRGRPKTQPQLVEAFTQDGVPFQITSARQNHLEKNRIAAHKCRQRKKVYIDSLESRAREFSGKNKILKDNVAQLREEVLELKNEVLRHAGCGFWAVDEYLARCAGDLLGMGPPTANVPSRNPSQTQSPSLGSLASQESKSDREASVYSPPSRSGMDVSNEEDCGGLELLNDLDDLDRGADDEDAVQ